MGVEFVGLEPCSSFGDEVPECPHGPMLLFEKADNSKKAGRQFYACSACRNRKQCAFFLWRDERLAPEKVRQWRERANRPVPVAAHRCRYTRAQEILSEGGLYCLDCSQLVPARETNSHRTHQTRPADQTSSRPSELLRPLACNKAEAQYLFSAETAVALQQLLRQAGVRRVLCCGAPRLHELLQLAGTPSLMLDCDSRYEEFWPPEKLCLYNMFNHHMFSTHGWEVFQEFVRRDAAEGLGLVIDPPFGGRLEALALTVQKMLGGGSPASEGRTTATETPVFLVLPYFNEPDVLRSFPGLHMTDFRVEYDNHDKYTSAAGGRKSGSPVRLFASVTPERLSLPEPTYRLCRPCRRWVHRDNRHCPHCHACTSKDGRPYRHCDPCGRCVKITWQHCPACGRCALPDHPCSERGPTAAPKRTAKRNAAHQKKRRRK